ncbi:DUF1826 domain-containing protein [Glaciimonas sp. GG7]
MLSANEYHDFLNSSSNYRLFSSPTSLLSEACRDLTYALPRDFSFHFLRRDYREFEAHLTQKLTQSLPAEVKATALINEVTSALSDFAQRTAVDHPLASLRVVTPEYLACESPSVSQYFHRDSTAVTITKVYFGEGAIYADNENVRREYFAKHSIQAPDVPDEVVLYNPSKTHVVPDGSMLLLKGEVYEDIDARSRELIDMFVPPDRILTFNRNNGFIHKGGGFSMGERRLVFTASVYV